MESKLIKAVEINEEDENDDYGDEEEVTFEEPDNFVEHKSDSNSQSVERPDFSLDKNITLKNQKEQTEVKKPLVSSKSRKRSLENNKLNIVSREHHKIQQYEDKIKRKAKRHEIFNKLQNQLSEFKSEMFNNEQFQGGF